MLQQPKQPEQQEYGKNVIKTDEPINPEYLAMDTHGLIDEITMILKLGSEHFENDQNIKKVAPTNIEGVCAHAADVLVWIDHIHLRVTNLARNHALLLEFLSRKATKEALDYNADEPMGKKRKYDPVSQSEDLMTE